MKLALVRARAPGFQGRLVGSLELPLSPEGKEKAQGTASSLRGIEGPVLVYHPGKGHAAEHARELASALLGATLREDRELGEVDLGLWQGLTEEELALRHPAAFQAFLTDAQAVVPPEAEELEAAFERLASAVERLRRRHRHDSRLVVVVASELAFVLLDAALHNKGAPPGLWRLRGAGEDLRRFELA
ncbi:histidine phosphatase family protein [bacterium]|nr:histidine phosphatase family protein [bacterium]